MISNNLKATLNEAMSVIFEENFHHPTVINNTAKSMGDYSNIMKQVNVGVAPGNGLGIDKRPNHHVANTPASQRNIGDETRNDWKTVAMKKPPIKPNSTEFVHKAIAAANDHLPQPREFDIPSSQRRFAMIYPALNNGINTSSPKIGV
jgi:hypothetical protein